MMILVNSITAEVNATPKNKAQGTIIDSCVLIQKGAVLVLRQLLQQTFASKSLQGKKKVKSHTPPQLAIRWRWWWLVSSTGIAVPLHSAARTDAILIKEKEEKGPFTQTPVLHASIAPSSCCR